LAVAVLMLAASGVEAQQYPNSTFTHNSDLNTAIDALWNRLLLLGTIVFVFVEVLLVITIFKFRKRPGGASAKQIHGHAALEITWTVIPALILVLIAVPTVRTIFKTQAKAPAGSLEVTVIGHQWWWEFRYPSLGITTANELYVPAGKTVNFTLQSRDVIHSFWTPQLGGKRDLIANRTNYLWYTVNADLAENVFNGFCTEYCGSSHANMRIRVYTVSPDKFDSWVKRQQANAAMSPIVSATPAVAVANTAPKGKPPVAAAPVATQPAVDGYVFPLDKMPKWTVPQTPVPAGIKYDDALLAGGDSVRGHDMVTNMKNMGTVPCLTCHIIRGEYAAMGLKDDVAAGPNLTHIASRHTFAGALYPTTPANLARWIKDSRVMKPGSLMTVLGIGEPNPMMKDKPNTIGLDDRQIADIVAYLMALK
jgi:cytochrome c oxidase subunit 2